MEQMGSFFLLCNLICFDFDCLAHTSPEQVLSQRCKQEIEVR